MNYLFYDYETTGTSKQFDQILQFAAIRTDANFNPISEPINLFCKLRKDIIPSPRAIKVTGIDINILNESALTEFDFAKRVEKELIGNGNQCIIGYNSKSFDDKFSQFLFYRNFIDPYRWAWDQYNSKLDLYDLILMAYSFDRLKNINYSDGQSEDSLKLEDLSRLNHLTHENAHDALSDVRATIELMKLVKVGNPKLLDYALDLKVKSNVSKILNSYKRFYHISSYYGYENKFINLQYLIGLHPSNQNTYISWNLNCDPELLLDLSAEEIRIEMFAKKSARKIHVGFTEIKTNQNPTIIGYTDKNRHPNVDFDLANQNLEKLQGVLPKIKAISYAVFNYEFPHVDADADLYAGHFFDEKKDDEKLINAVYLNPLTVNADSFKAIRFTKLLKRLLGRNFYDKLSETDKANFDLFCQKKFNSTTDDKWRTFQQYQDEFKAVMQEENLTPKQINALKILDDYVQKLIHSEKAID